MTMTYDGANGITFPDSSLQKTAGYSPFRNRIINGDMRIDQRNSGASVSGDGSFAVDRFNSFKNTGSYTGQRSTDAPSGFQYSYLYTNTSATSTSYAGIMQIVEGYTVADFGFGASGAATVSLSFWVKSSLTGTFGVSLRNNASDRSYVASYTINSANTWEQKVVTINGDTAGTWVKDNGAGIRVWWDLGVGSGNSTTAGSWQAGNYFGLTGGTKLTNTSGATFYITGVQLEKGSVATPFEYRPYGQELALCQRYYNAMANWVFGGTQGSCYSFPVKMRAAPTVTGSAAGFATNQASVDSWGGYQTSNGNCNMTFASEL